MDITGWITFDPTGGGGDDVDAIAQSRLARDLQSTLRNQIDPGIDLKSARLAQSIRAQATGGQIVIDEDDQAKLFSGGVDGDDGGDEEPPAGNLDDLFKPGSGVPEAVSRPDGSMRLVFRSISAADVFGQQAAQRRSDMVERVVTDTLRNGLVDAIEDATKESARGDVTGGGT